MTAFTPRFALAQLLVPCLALLGGAACERASTAEPAPVVHPSSEPHAAPHAGNGSQPPHPMPKNAPPPKRAPASSAGGLRWTAGSPLVAETPSSGMRAAQYAVRGEGGAAELAVYYFGTGQGGTVKGNLERWIGQMKQPDGTPSEQRAEVVERDVAGLKLTRLDLSGTYAGGMGAGAPAGPHQRLLGAVVEGPRGPVFFKLVGPERTVAAAVSAFDELLQSVQPE